MNAGNVTAEKQLQKTNRTAAAVRENAAIFSIGKAVNSWTDQAYLFEKILEGAVGGHAGGHWMLML
jgi:hypothetical protein